MGWESNNVFQVLIIQGSTGSGLFVYSPAPGAGNLIATIAAAGGTDPYGNAYVAGITDYVGGEFIQMFQSGGQPELFFHSTGVVNAGTIGAPGAGVGGFELALLSPTGTADTNGSLLIQSQNATGGSSPNVVIPSPTTLLATALATLTAGLSITAGGAAVTGGSTTDTLHVTSTSTFNAKETITAGGLAVTGGETADTVAISSAQAAGDVLTVTNTTAAPTNPNVQLTSQGASDKTLAITVAGNSFASTRMDSDGSYHMGSGAAAVDVALSRTAAGIMNLANILELTNHAAPAALSGAVRVFADGGMLGIVNPSGLQLDASEGQQATFPAVTVTGTTFTSVATFAIPANDAEVGATYELWVHGHGTQGSTAQGVNAQVTLGGTGVGVSVGSSSAFCAASQGFRWHMHVLLVCHATGTSGTWQSSFTLTLTQPGAATNTQTMTSGTSGDTTISTTVSNNLTPQLNWNSGTGSPTLTSDFASFRRVA